MTPGAGLGVILFFQEAQRIHSVRRRVVTLQPKNKRKLQTYLLQCNNNNTQQSNNTNRTTIMSVFNAKGGNPSQHSPRKVQVQQSCVFAWANQSTHHLIDRGDNGGLAGAEMRVLQKTHRKINIVGIDDHELTGLNLVTAAALMDTQKGPIIGIFHEYAHLGKDRSIHAAGQMGWFNCKVDDRPKVVGGAQRIETSDGYVIPLSIASGLAYMHPIRIPTDNDLELYPHVFFISPETWDASVLDHDITPPPT